MQRLLLALGLLAVAIPAASQTGVLTGKITSENGRVVSEARVYVQNGKDTAISDVDGNFRLSLKQGSYLVVVDSRLFAEYTDSITIKTGEELFFNPTLSTAKEMGLTKITGKRKIKENTVAAAIKTKQLSVQLVEAISAEDFKRTTIRTTADAMKRIPGATIMEGKFANIRGMFDRYNAGYLNGAPLPSTETDRKAFSFDIIPASLLDNIVVIKSGTPDLTGDFGGGIIRINTKSIPEKLTQNLNFGLQYNSITTFRPIDQFASSTSEYFGIPGSNRKLPQLEGELLVSNPAEKNATESQKFNNDWSLKRIAPMLTPRLSYSIGVPFKLKKQREIGLLVSLNYSVTQKYSDATVSRFDLSDNRPLSIFEDRLLSNNVQNGGIMNLSFKLNNRNRIDIKNLYTLNYDASSTLRGGIANYDDGIGSEGYSNLVNFNRLASTQANGSHVFGKNQSTLTWLVNYGNTRREVPDFRIAQYALIDQDRYLVLNDFFNAGSGRFFSNLDENTLSASADIQHSIQTGKLTSNIKYGVFRQVRNRTFKSREFVYGPVGKTILSKNQPDKDLSPENIGPGSVYLIEKTSVDADEYNGYSSLNAAYFMAEHHYPLFKSNNKPKNLKVIYGLRAEQFNQYLTNNYFDNLGKKLADGGITLDLLPSLNIITPISGRTGIRMAYYKTVNRPEMREMAPFSFYNFNLNSEILGNTSLKRAILHNFDFRYEIFGNREDMFSIGAFVKRIINPIEFSLETSQPAIRTFSYQNEKSADIQGIELEVRKNLSFIGQLMAPKFFKYLSFYGNFSLIQSSVQFKSQSTGTPGRSLQGQSPYVVNASLFYENPKGWNASVNFNKLGSRIAYIGVAKDIQPFGTDIYEFGRSVLDLQIGKNFKRLGNLKITIGDLLRQNSAFYQDLNNDGRYTASADNTLFKFTNGSTVTLGYSYTF
jgi:hypothetical protein